MDMLVLDFETFYSDEYTLSSATTESYIRDSRFEIIGAALKYNDTPAFWLLPDRLDYHLRHEVDWANTIMIAHHSHFDGAILYWYYGQRPAMHICTLSMARACDGPKAKNGLEYVAPRHNLGYKGDFVKWAKGKRGADFTADETRQYGLYACQDAELEYKVAQVFLPLLPAHELRLIDLTVRMFTEPVLQGDAVALRSAVVSERKRKKDLLTELGYICKACNGSGIEPVLPNLPGSDLPCKKCGGLGFDRKPFTSKDKFAAILRAHGEEPETKPSPTGPEKQIYAFAKTDPYMQALEDDPNETIAALATARLSVTSNIIETRAERFQFMAERGLMPVYLKYCGAHTWRWSGGDKTNWQNMSNAMEDAPRPEMAVLKQSIYAPDGHMIVAADSGQGEARVLAWLAGQADLVEAFAQKRDIYSEFGTMIYGRPIDRKKVKTDYIMGQVSKICILSFGFGSGYYTASLGFLKGVLGAPPVQFKYEDMATMGIDPTKFLNSPNKVAQVANMPSRLELNDRLIHCIVTDALVKRYRAKYQAICGKHGFWQLMERVIGCMITGQEMTFGPGDIFRVSKERIDGPTGIWLEYKGIQRDSHTGDATYFDGRKRTKIYGSLLTENIVQHVHRLIVAGQMLEIAEVVKVVLSTHDDVAVVVPAEAAELTLKFMIQTLSHAPAWAVGLPLTAEGGIGRTLAEAK